MMDAGHIRITMRPDVSIHNSRPADLGRVFVGKQPEEVARLVSLLFAVCSKAQGLAARKALGLPAAPEDMRAVIWEALREHFLRIARDWRVDAATDADASLLKAIFTRQASGTANAAGQLLALLAAPTADIMKDETWIWSGHSQAAGFLRAVLEQKWNALGDCEHAGETSPLVLCRDEPVMQVLIRQHGRGLFSRLYARLVHCTRLVIALQESAEAAALAGNQVITSRGNLRHAAEVKGDRVVRYAITAPTDVNFAPGGPAAQSLAALSQSCESGMDIPARLLIQAFDPCVPFSLELQ